jgi:mannose-6-phosphate isomerase
LFSLPQDPGILCALATMNYLRLSPGQALYVPADGLHAWLSGDIVECMARSDNVLNVGLCPPDARSPVADFLECLTLDPASPDACILAGTRRQGGVTVEYAPPLGEFRVLALDAVGRPARDETWTAAAGPGVFWVVEGKGSVRAEGEEFAVEAGDVYFIGHHTELKLDGDMKAYMAFTH